jgi:hypothetical protein
VLVAGIGYGHGLRWADKSLTIPPQKSRQFLKKFNSL